MRVDNVMAFASLHISRTASGQLIRVRIVTATAIQWRAYQVDRLTDAVVARALRSTGLERAWVQSLLPGLPLVVDIQPIGHALFPAELQPVCNGCTPPMNVGSNTKA